MRLRRVLLAMLAWPILLPGTIAPAAPAADPLRSKQWALDKINAPAAWRLSTGRGVTIAVVDSGVDLGHPDLAANLVPGRNFITSGAPPQDDCGHGTHVAGIAAAPVGNGKGIAGVAPGAKIMPVRVLEGDGSGECTGNIATVIEGLDWAVENGARVVNLSVGDRLQGLRGAAAEFSEALDRAWSHGAIPVVAAGNDYILSSGYADDHALIVSATTQTDGEASYSSGVGAAMWGIAAPGGNGSLFCDADGDIWSTYLRSQDPCGAPEGYETMAGTSMAAPMVAGGAAMLLSLGLSRQQTVSRLLATAEDLGTTGRDSTFGAGRLDLGAATNGLGSPAAPPKPAIPTVPPRSDPPGTPPADEQPAPATHGAGEPSRTASPSPSPSPSPTGGASGPLASPNSDGGGGPSAGLTAGAAALIAFTVLGWRRLRRTR